MTQSTPPMPSEVRAVFDAWPKEARVPLLKLRTIIYATALRTPGVGPLEEALRWGEPAYLTSHSRSGSTIRLGWKPSRPTQVAMYFHCRTNLVATFRTVFPREFVYEGVRAIVLGIDDAFDRDTLALCVAASLRYRLDRARHGARGSSS